MRACTGVVLSYSFFCANDHTYRCRRTYGTVIRAVAAGIAGFWSFSWILTLRLHIIAALQHLPQKRPRSLTASFNPTFIPNTHEPRLSQVIISSLLHLPAAKTDRAMESDLNDRLRFTTFTPLDHRPRLSIATIPSAVYATVTLLARHLLDRRKPSRPDLVGRGKYALIFVALTNGAGRARQSL